MGKEYVYKFAIEHISIHTNDFSNAMFSYALIFTVVLERLTSPLKMLQVLIDGVALDKARRVCCSRDLVLGLFCYILRLIPLIPKL
jgi:hypothetical protein